MNVVTPAETIRRRRDNPSPIYTKLTFSVVAQLDEFRLHARRVRRSKCPECGRRDFDLIHFASAREVEQPDQLLRLAAQVLLIDRHDRTQRNPCPMRTIIREYSYAEPRMLGI